MPGSPWAPTSPARRDLVHACRWQMEQRVVQELGLGWHRNKDAGFC